jgi:hypothetical protein
MLERVAVVSALRLPAAPRRAVAHAVRVDEPSLIIVADVVREQAKVWIADVGYPRESQGLIGFVTGLFWEQMADWQLDTFPDHRPRYIL